MEGNKSVTASDMMSRDVITVKPDTSVEELGRLFIEKGISGMPVIDNEGSLYGVVTESDLISKEQRFHIPTVLHVFDAIIPLGSADDVEDEIRKMTATMVEDICTKDVVTVDEDASLNDIATIMSDRKIHLLPVMKDGEIVGIIGKKDLIKAIAAA